jgi:PAS domain S-box-containing protein
MRVAYCRPDPAEPWPAPAGAPPSWLVPVCTDCDSLVELVLSASCDAVLLRLPASSAEWLRALSRLRAAAPGVPVVAVVPPERENDGADAVAAGAADYWLDGSSATRLRVTVERASALRRVLAYNGARDEALDRVADAVVVTDADEVADPIFVKDRDHRFLYVNDALCELTARKREELLGRSDYDFFPKEQADVFWRQDELVFTSGRTDANEETLTDAKGQVHILVTKKSTWTDREGRKVLVGVIRDITELVATADELKRSQLLLRHAQKMEAVGRLAGGVAHDFNNLLTAIVGGANLLLESLPSGHEGRVDAEEVRKAGERAVTLTRRLLSFARRDPAAARVVCPKELVEGMRPLLERLLPPHVEIELALPEAAPPVRIDPGEFEQVLLNLVLNAGDAMPRGGRVTVALSEDAGGGALLSVTDTGAGMDPQTAARVFEPFFTTKSGGTGLGLATVRDIVRGSGGSVDVESEPGRGASFHVRWPRSEEGRRGSDGGESAGLRMAPRRASVLVAEDDDVVRRFVARCLERAGCDVVTAVDGLEALRLGEAHEGAFDVLILDAVLPRMGGLELLQRLRRSQPTAQVVFMSGYRAEEALGGAKAPGPFLLKPFTAADLSDVVGALLSR